jgi:protein gp37
MNPNVAALLAAAQAAHEKALARAEAALDGLAAEVGAAGGVRSEIYQVNLSEENMADKTTIEWADSTCNLQMGCDGCELWNPKTGVFDCYAGVMTRKWAGKRGWPEAFDRPALFLDRLDDALRWRDLTGTRREGKPWLDGLPRLVFLDDMGDTFTESLPLDWLAPILPRLASSPHQWLLLTKRPQRMAAFAAQHPLPPNVWPGTSVTGPGSLGRLEHLCRVQGGGVRWVSAEPLWDAIDLSAYLPRLGWVILGGQSGADARPCEVEHLRSALGQCQAAGVPVFVKQLGDNPVAEGLGFLGKKGGDWSRWPADLRVRQVPAVACRNEALPC